MSDDDRPDEPATEPRTRPRPSPRAAEPTVDESAVEPAEPKGPVSAASRARRIGGRPVVPTAPADLDKSRPSPPPPPLGQGRHLATPPANLTKAKPPKEAKARKPPKAPNTAEGASANTTAWIPTLVLGTAALVLIVLIAVAGHGVYYAKSGVSTATSNTSQQEALAAAKSCIATINTYDYRTLAKNEANALACITGSFTETMKQTYTKTLLPEAPVAKATQSAQINYAGIHSISPNGKQIQVLLYGQLVVNNVSTASQGSPRYDLVGLMATMQDVGGKWLVAKYETDTGATASK